MPAKNQNKKIASKRTKPPQEPGPPGRTSLAWAACRTLRLACKSIGLIVVPSVCDLKTYALEGSIRIKRLSA